MDGQEGDGQQGRVLVQALDHEPGPVGGGPPDRGGDTQHLETGILKRNRQRERVIDVIADVGVDDDGQRARSVGRGHIRERDTRRHECRRAQQARRLRRGTFHYLTARV